MQYVLIYAHYMSNANSNPTMTKTHRNDSRKALAQKYATGKGVWYDGHEPENLWMVMSCRLYSDVSNSMQAADVEYRQATRVEFVPARLRWLENELSRVSSNCRYGMPENQLGTLERECRAEALSIKAEIAQLTSEVSA